MSQLKRRDKKPSHTPVLAKARPLGGGGGSDLGGSRKQAPAAPPGAPAPVQPAVSLLVLPTNHHHLQILPEPSLWALLTDVLTRQAGTGPTADSRPAALRACPVQSPGRLCWDTGRMRPVGSDQREQQLPLNVLWSGRQASVMPVWPHPRGRPSNL